MSGWQLGLTLFGVAFVSWLAGAASLVVYGRRLARRKLAQFIDQASSTSLP